MKTVILVKFNDCHDPSSGKFCGSGGGGSGGDGGGGGPGGSSGDGGGGSSQGSSDLRVRGKGQDTLSEFSVEMQATNDKLAESQNMTEGQGSAFLRYSSDDYADINKGLRGDPPIVDSSAKAMDSAFKTASIGEEVVAFRGMGSSAGESIVKAGVGGVVVDKAFVSMTLNPVISDVFAKGGGAGKVVMQVRIPKGSKVISMAKITSFREEAEVLGNRGSQFRITGIEKVSSGKDVFDGYTVVSADLI